MEPTRRGIREPFCGLSHLLGALLSAVALPFLLARADGRPEHILSLVLYGIGLITLYSASALYHSLHVSPRAESVLLRLDYSAIFLLIAGTYAPMCLIALQGTLGWTMFAIEYGLALFGIVAVFYRLPLPDIVRVGLYLGMGWLALIALGPLRHALTTEGLAWLFAGGLFYSIGTVIFTTDRPHLWPGRFSAHDLWHVFVMSGSVCHFILIWRFVATR